MGNVPKFSDLYRAFTPLLHASGEEPWVAWGEDAAVLERLRDPLPPGIDPRPDVPPRAFLQAVVVTKAGPNQCRRPLWSSADKHRYVCGEWVVGDNSSLCARCRVDLKDNPSETVVALPVGTMNPNTGDE